MATVLVGCGGTHTVTKTVAGPTVTATVTVPGPTATVTAPAMVKTNTVRVTVTTTAAPNSDSASLAEESISADPASDFDRAYAIEKAGDVTDDIRTVDERLGDGIGVSSALGLLSDSYGRLASAGTPPGVAAAKYQSRIQTLQSFASTAADMYDDQPTEGHARYAVVRKETEPVFQQLNSALGTNLRLP